jgi:uncharacterized caspase-like protein
MSPDRPSQNPSPFRFTYFLKRTKDGQEAFDGDGNNSPFAEALAKEILTPNLEIRRLFDRVRDDVLNETHDSQQPFTYGSLSGWEDFYFVQK